MCVHQVYHINGVSIGYPLPIMVCSISYPLPITVIPIHHINGVLLRLPLPSTINREWNGCLY